jgi:hypothetical protein
MATTAWFLANMDQAIGRSNVAVPPSANAAAK